MEAVSIREAETHLARLIARVEAGEEITISRDRVPVAKLVPIEQPSRARVPGALAGQIEVGPGFDEIPPGFDLTSA